MAYPINTGAILTAAGYEPLVDFICERAAGSELTLEWLHTDPQPTEAQVAAWSDDSQALPHGATFTDHTTVPKEVTNYQLKRALNTVPADRAAVDALVAGADQDTQDGWNNALSFKSDNALFAGAISVLGWSQTKVNDYLKLAATFD